MVTGKKGSIIRLSPDPEGSAETPDELEAEDFNSEIPGWRGIIATSTRFCVVPGVKHNGRLAWAVGYTGNSINASRYGARIGIELLGYQPSVASG